MKFTNFVPSAWYEIYEQSYEGSLLRISLVRASCKGSRTLSDIQRSPDRVA